MKHTHKVYALFDPRIAPIQVAYVGCTATSIESRLTAHIAMAVSGTSQAPVSEWIRALILDDVEPVFMLLERTTVERWQERERYWVERHSTPNLLNVASGGQGSPGARRTEKRKQEVGDFFRGKKLSDEHREKMSLAKAGHEVTQETRDKIAAKLAGRKQSDLTKQKRRETMEAKPYRHSEAIKQAMSERRRGAKMQPLSDTTKSKLSQSISNLMWVTDGTTNRRIQRTQDLPPGWWPGRK